MCLKNKGKCTPHIQGGPGWVGSFDVMHQQLPVPSTASLSSLPSLPAPRLQKLAPAPPLPTATAEAALSSVPASAAHIQSATRPPSPVPPAVHALHTVAPRVMTGDGAQLGYRGGSSGVSTSGGGGGFAAEIVFSNRLANFASSTDHTGTTPAQPPAASPLEKSQQPATIAPVSKGNARPVQVSSRTLLLAASMRPAVA